jgi:hypothetical protein
MTDLDIRAWLSLCRAAQRLPKSKREQWHFMVGVGGTLAERTRLGAAALASLGRVWSFTPGKEADDAS